MKATGIVRRIDDLGRVVIPKEIRRTLRIREGDPLEIFTREKANCRYQESILRSEKSALLPDCTQKALHSSHELYCVSY